jgi:dihydropteroate synthase
MLPRERGGFGRSQRGTMAGRMQTRLRPVHGAHPYTLPAMIDTGGVPQSPLACSPTTWRGHALRWGAHTHIMAILNLTPDSFSGDGLGGDADAAVAAALASVADGADILDLGAESTRPGHVPISAEQELARLLPALAAIRPRTDAIISVDTSKAAVAVAALDAGADLVNDIRGFTADPEMAAVVAAAGVPAVLMHDIPPDPGVDLVTSILRELSRRLDRAVAAGVAWERLIVDPGFGFGKDWRQNLELLHRLGELRVLGRPILTGTSRKSTIGRVLGLPEHDRVEGTAATVTLAIANGADIVRVHDVRAMTRVARMTDAVVRGAPDQPLTWPGGSPP